ncbi:MAG: polyribonucleotide nucleotidyltransferase [bacterium]
MYNEKTTTVSVGGKDMIFKTGKLAPRADAAIWAQMGETVVFTVVSMGSENTELDYFPLSIEYIEKFYAGGIISGSRFIKRERRPSDEATLKARQVDHSIRSLFPKGFKRDVSVVINVLSYDGVNNPEVLAVNSTSMALMISDIPFNGPSAAVKLAVKAGQISVNGIHEATEIDGEFIVSVREDKILNIEGWGKEIPEEMMDQVLDSAVKECQPILAIQKTFAAEVGKKKLEFAEAAVDQDILEVVKAEAIADITRALYDAEDRNAVYKEIVTKIQEAHEDWSAKQILEAVEYQARRIMRDNILANEKRTSGRKLEEIRELEIEVGVLPRVHGSALFRRGQTQCLSVLTLGSTRLGQVMESFEGEEEKNFMHHYNSPNYSFGAAGRYSYYPGRREVGHGNIGESGLRNLIPDISAFPYTIRVVSEIMSQNGSSSMAATCASSLALMDAGIPLKKQVGAIAIGLVTDDADVSKYKLLTDMEDVEDFYGDMDFKVTGTELGLTAIQLDNKLMGIPAEILKVAFRQSRKARMEVLAAMNAVLSAPRSTLSKYAPRVESIKINPAKIGEVIGPGGKMIKAIIEAAGVGTDIDIQDDGQVNITALNQEQIAIAKKMVMDIVAEPEVGQIYDAKIDKITTYGAFVNVSPSITGLVHISELTDGFIKDPHELIHEGQEVKVKLLGMDRGKQSFSMKGLNNFPAKQVVEAKK